MLAIAGRWTAASAQRQLLIISNPNREMRWPRFRHLAFDPPQTSATLQHIGSPPFDVAILPPSSNRSDHFDRHYPTGLRLKAERYDSPRIGAASGLPSGSMRESCERMPCWCGLLSRDPRRDVQGIIVDRHGRSYSNVTRWSPENVTIPNRLTQGGGTQIARRGAPPAGEPPNNFAAVRALYEGRYGGESKC